MKLRCSEASLVDVCQSPAGDLLAVGPLEPARVVELGTGA